MVNEPASSQSPTMVMKHGYVLFILSNDDPLMKQQKHTQPTGGVSRASNVQLIEADTC